LARQKEKGQALVEFAVVLPVLVILVFAIIQFGILFRNYLDLTDAVRAGARVAAVSREKGRGADAEAAVRAAASLDDADLDVTVNSTWARGSSVTVRAQYPYDIDILGVVVFSGDLVSQTTERVE
jgi:Flp pilus assembly protein TadG